MAAGCTAEIAREELKEVASVHQSLETSEAVQTLGRHSKD